MKEDKHLSITQIAKITGRTRTTIYRILKEELNYIPYNRLVKGAEDAGSSDGIQFLNDNK